MSSWQPTVFIALAVVRLGRRFLLVHERKHGERWYLPAGRADPGERLVDAAARETLEEAGIPIVVDGIVRVEHTPLADYARVRAIFTAYPADDTPPKSIADRHSQAAAWVSLDELDRYPLRGDEVRQILTHVADGGPIYPLDLLTLEGAPYPVRG
ncbi:MAG: NUDIX domain-containing protein [Myxococcales bacterium]|nr:NUDIX domain-containing protein [Myxococcales bacterium]MCB9704028.1 NUDIX domain-containing protein [Myxococcales bacterium]